MANHEDVVVFYAWQTDSPNKTNRAAIRDALRVASSQLEAEFSDRELRLILEEATRDDPGSPNIPQRIIEKIKASDIFVCDVTTINVDAAGVSRKTPNPNVIFELGFAVAHLGWDRIVMLFNEAFGHLSDLPFDIDRQRASLYKLSNDPARNTAGGREQLRDLVTLAIRTILEKNPPKVSDALTPQEERRRRDISNISWLLENVHWPTVEAHIEQSPKFVSNEILHFWDAFDEAIRSKSFHLYDSELFDKFKKVRDYWAQSLEYPNHYESKPGQRGSLFTTSQGMAWRRDWEAIETANRKLSAALDDLFSDLRNRYLEIEIDERNGAAWAKYQAFQQRDDRWEQVLARALQRARTQRRKRK